MSSESDKEAALLDDYLNCLADHLENPTAPEPRAEGLFEKMTPKHQELLRNLHDTIDQYVKNS